MKAQLSEPLWSLESILSIFTVTSMTCIMANMEDMGSRLDGTGCHAVIILFKSNDQADVVI